MLLIFIYGLLLVFLFLFFSFFFCLGTTYMHLAVIPQVVS